MDDADVASPFIRANAVLDPQINFFMIYFQRKILHPHTQYSVVKGNFPIAPFSPALCH